MTAILRAVAALEAADRAGCAAVLDPDDLRELVDALMVKCDDCGERTTDPTPCTFLEHEHCPDCLEACEFCQADYWTDLDADCARDEARDR